jgi:hypothetical protein
MRTLELVAVVTQDHLKRGQACRANCCPIALALNDAIKAAFPGSGMTAFITHHETSLTRDGYDGRTLYSCVTPDDARRFIEEFDRVGNSAVTSNMCGTCSITFRFTEAL